MPSTNHPLLERLVLDHPELQFHTGDAFEWQPGLKTIIYDASDPYFESRLLHETAHAELNHSKYERDIDLIAMERDAWQHARMVLSPKYAVSVEATVIHNDMDTYRDWMHDRSTCPSCQSSGLQIKKNTYKCVTCLKTWRVNEARTCQLKRYKV